MSRPTSSPDHDHDTTRPDPQGAGGGPGVAPAKRTLTQGLPSLRGRERDVAQFDVAGDYREGRATIAGPSAAGPGDDAGDYRESRATIDGPPAAGPGDDAGDYRESRATIDGPPTGPLDARQLRKARRRNPYWHQRLGFAPAAFGGGGVASDELAEHVAARQAEHGLPVDGIAGPKTVAAVAGGPASGGRTGAASADVADQGAAGDDPFGMHLLG